MDDSKTIDADAEKEISYNCPRGSLALLKQSLAAAGWYEQSKNPARTIVTSVSILENKLSNGVADLPDPKKDEKQTDYDKRIKPDCDEMVQISFTKRESDCIQENIAHMITKGHLPVNLYSARLIQEFSVET